MENGHSGSAYECGNRHLAPTICALGAMVIIALGGCNQTATNPSAEEARYEATQERHCMTTNFHMEDYTVVDMASSDPAVRATLAHAGKVMEQSASDVQSKYCMLEKARVKEPERCFRFLFKIPTPGGGGMICILNGRDISRVHLDE